MLLDETSAAVRAPPSEGVSTLESRTMLSAVHSWIRITSASHNSLTYLPTSLSLQSVPCQWRLFQQHQHPAAPLSFEDWSLRNPRSRRNLRSSLYSFPHLLIICLKQELTSSVMCFPILRRASPLSLPCRVSALATEDINRKKQTQTKYRLRHECTETQDRNECDCKA